MPRPKRGKKKNKQQKGKNPGGPESEENMAVMDLTDSAHEDHDDHETSGLRDPLPTPANISEEPVSTHAIGTDADAQEGILNKWNGARAIDISKFLSSRHAFPPNMDDPICGVYVLPEVRNMFLKVLPLETALIFWYNKTRKSARICPACRRYYLVGDTLLPHVMDQKNSRAEYLDPRNVCEKRISGICSLMCFGIASYNWPGCIGAWGKWMAEVDPDTRLLMQEEGGDIADDGMGALMKWSRDGNLLGVLQMCCDNGLALY